VHDFHGKTALITGASRGIGRAVALHHAESEGADLVLLGRDERALVETAEMARARGGHASCFLADVTDRARLAALAADLGPLDGLVTAAGRSGLTSPLQDHDATFDAILATNLTGTWNTVRAFLPRMSEGGRIVQVASVLGRFGVPAYGAYCASKHGVLGLAKALALELVDRGIFVNAVAPGWVDTDMATEGIGYMAQAMGISPAEARRIAERAVPVQRFFQPGEIARGIAWLLDPANTMQVGQCLNLDGGQVQN
jgi:NAD(P)-dependent dehydrogenase (short-subunit alcohol dehydrogenase family)